ncbi:hypothetical protein M9H77_06812 [Catharanthus roseus]|uniref:Uncharacterized protein n=1 Tax=Catharanthus roseus TaxID=4058 RepID=A0ACC0BT56_CATRO|nr:hypothetical protein M9H77_06812 [Catharanthus roseus]
MNQMSQSPLDLKLGPITRAQKKKLKLQEDNNMIAYMEDALKSKIEELDGQGKLPNRVLVLDSIDSRFSSLCDWGFEALVLHWSFEATKSLIEVLQSKEVMFGRVGIQFNN